MDDEMWQLAVPIFTLNFRYNSSLAANTNQRFRYFRIDRFEFLVFLISKVFFLFKKEIKAFLNPADRPFRNIYNFYLH